MNSSFRISGGAALVQAAASVVPFLLLPVLSSFYKGDFSNLANWPEGFQPFVLTAFVQMALALTVPLIILGLYDHLHDDAPTLARFSLILATAACAGLLLSAASVVGVTEIKQRIPAEFQVSTYWSADYGTYNPIRQGAGAAFGLAYAVIAWIGLSTGKLPRLLCILFIVGGLAVFADTFVSGRAELIVRFISVGYVVADLWLGLWFWRNNSPVTDPRKPAMNVTLNTR